MNSIMNSCKIVIQKKVNWNGVTLSQIQTSTDSSDASSSKSESSESVFDDGNEEGELESNNYYKQTCKFTAFQLQFSI